MVSEKALDLSERFFHPLQDEDDVGTGSRAWLLIRTTAGLFTTYQARGLTHLKISNSLGLGG